MPYTDYMDGGEFHGMLRGSDYNFDNTTSPTTSPTKAPIDNGEFTYTEVDKQFIGIFFIFPAAFAAATGAISGAYTALPGKDTYKYHITSKTGLLGYSLLTAGLSLDFGNHNIGTDSHISAVTWILASVPVTFFVIENKFKEFARGYMSLNNAVQQPSSSG